MCRLIFRWLAPMRMLALLCMCFVTGCGTKVLQSGEVPISPIYTQDGVELKGYRAYADGMMNDLLKDCHAALDQKRK